MSFATFLKDVLIGFVQVYQKYFRKTFVMALLLSIVCFVVALILMVYVDHDSNVSTRAVSLLSFFYSRYSYLGAYRFVDVTKTMFVFLAAIFSINIIRYEQSGQATTEKMRFGVTFTDIF